MSARVHHATTGRGSGRAALAGVVQAADLRDRHDLAESWTLHFPAVLVDPDGRTVWTKLGKFVIRGGDVRLTVGARRPKVPRQG